MTINRKTILAKLMASPFLSGAILLIVFGLLLLALYGNSLDNDLYLDDHVLIAQRAWAMQNVPLAEHFRHYAGVTHFRPICSLSNSWLYQFFGNQVRLYHIFNLFLFAALALMFLALARRATERWSTAIMAVLFFCCHPINTVFLNFITTKIFVFQALCLNSSLLAFACGQRSRFKARMILMLGSLCLYLLALLSHPAAVVFPVVVWLWSVQIGKTSWRQGLLRMIPYLVILGGYVIFCQLSPALRIPVGHNFQALNLDVLQYVAAVIELLGWYFSRWLFPHDIIFIKNLYPYVGRPMVSIFLGVTALVALFLVLKRWESRGPVMFAAGWTLTAVPLAMMGAQVYPFMGPTLEIMWMIYPSLGFFLLVAILMSRFADYVQRDLVLMAVGLILLGMISQTRKDNLFWRDELVYNERLLKIAPNNPVVIRKTGIIHEQRGSLDQALDQYFHVIKIVPGFRPAEMNGRVSAIYERKMDFPRASAHALVAAVSEERCSNCFWPYFQTYDRLVQKFHLLNVLNTDPSAWGPSDSFVEVMNRAHWQALNGQFVQAIALFERSLSLTDKETLQMFIWSKLAVLYYAEQDLSAFPKAVAHLSQGRGEEDVESLLRNASALFQVPLPGEVWEHVAAQVK